MSETVPAGVPPVIQPELAGVNASPVNETPVVDPSPASNSVIERVKQAGAKVFSKHGVKFKRGPGRPRLDGSPGAGDVQIGGAPAPAPVVSAAVPAAPDTPALDPLLIKRCCSAVLKAIGGILDSVLHRKATKAGLDKAQAQKICSDCAITEEETTAFSELAGICLQKYGVGTKYAPEIGLGAIIIGVGIRYGAAIKVLQAEIDSRRPAPSPALEILPKEGA